MELLNLLSQQLNPQVTRGLGQQVGVDESQANQAISALLPMMIAGLSKNVSKGPEAQASLSRALERDHDGSILDHLGSMLGGGTQQAGGGLGAMASLAGSLLGGGKNTGGAAANLLGSLMGGSQGGAGGLLGSLLGGNDSGLGNVLGSLLGSAPVSSRATNVEGMLQHMLGGQAVPVQQGVSKATGLDAKKVGAMMAVLAPMVLGALGRVKRQNNLDAAGVAKLVQAEEHEIEKKVPGFSPGQLMQLLDKDGDGRIDDDMIGFAQSLAKAGVLKS